MKAVTIPSKNSIPIPDPILSLLTRIANLMLDISEEDRETIRKIHEALTEIEHELRKLDSWGDLDGWLWMVERAEVVKSLCLFYLSNH